MSEGWFCHRGPPPTACVDHDNVTFHLSSKHKQRIKMMPHLRMKAKAIMVIASLVSGRARVALIAPLSLSIAAKCHHTLGERWPSPPPLWWLISSHLVPDLSWLRSKELLPEPGSRVQTFESRWGDRVLSAVCAEALGSLTHKTTFRSHPYTNQRKQISRQRLLLAFWIGATLFSYFFHVSPICCFPWGLTSHFLFSFFFLT